MADFVHLHNHSHYSLLDGACKIKDLIKKTLAYEMNAIALTDHGNMFGAVEFYKAARAQGIKPIIGSEVYIAPGSRFDKGGDKKSGGHSYHLVLLCKNDIGYKNLMKLVSFGYTQGFYYKPRIDLELLGTYSEGLVALSACLKGEVASTYLRSGYESALNVVQKYVDIFADDFYLEVQNHGIPEEDHVREGIYKIGAHTGIKIVATNDIHYLEEEHWEAHDVLLCLQTGKDYDDPNRMRYNSHALFFKNYDQMRSLFPDRPNVLENSLEVADKCHLDVELGRYHLPAFEIPKDNGSKSLAEYLRKLAYKGLQERYTKITPEIENRLERELDVISSMGYDGYFLITQDFINYAKQQRIPVGPGRGSAAGSLVAYCLGITDLDPIKYDLYFERFLNPERVSMPDIDIDFCYERREEVIDYVKRKYGANSVCQIITFGTMAARAVVRDVGRVLKMSYGDVDKIAKLIPTQSKSLDDALSTVKELKNLSERDETHRRLIQYARVLEGLARHSSTHAAGVVIAPGELTDYIPLYKTKDGDITTQYEMKVLDETGMLKMDFLGLRTLTVIQYAVEAIARKGIKIDLKNLPLDDPKVYELFGNGHTVGIFQFESSGMQEYLKKLKPTSIEDLIAMNALYRPGPMAMIDDFIDRKYGRKKIEYLHPKLEGILHNTYGIIVYQEQVMRIASDLAGYSLGGADLLRRAMGKKKIEEMEKQRLIFIDGCKKNGIPEQKAREIFSYMEEFAKYGFNKSHSASYSVVAYQTAYLKVHYPAEFMAATISSEMNSSDRVTILLEECRRMGLDVLPPDVNESNWDFVVAEGKIHFGLGAVKNVGKGAVESIVNERQENGPYSSIFDLARRMNQSSVNRKVFESLSEAGAFDSLIGTRAQQYAAVEAAVEFAQKTRRANGSDNQASLFDFDGDKAFEIPEPSLPVVEEWKQNDILHREKNILGFFLSGHPLDDYRDEVNAFSTLALDHAAEQKDQTPARICGIISDVKMHMDRKKRPMAFFKVEDFTGSIEGLAFADAYETYRAYIYVDSMVVISGRINAREGSEPKLIVNEVYTLEEARKKFTRNLVLSVETDHVNTNLLDEVRTILDVHRGEIPVYINMKTPGNGTYVLKSRSLKIKPTLELVEQLRDKIGRQNVWVGG
ncbi:DNA polymerase III subunit alpha [candidate division KSB1 bacterium]|nr:DNA polymerase III subunit alpha [candidate division KSB1 bacterium]RQW01210.1 MAG: DNA polymerase III subunit alpha [candidate division KSB1 bacterium]